MLHLVQWPQLHASRNAKQIKVPVLMRVKRFVAPRTALNRVVKVVSLLVTANS